MTANTFADAYIRRTNQIINDTASKRQSNSQSDTVKDSLASSQDNTLNSTQSHLQDFIKGCSRNRSKDRTNDRSKDRSKDRTNDRSKVRPQDDSQDLSQRKSRTRTKERPQTSPQVQSQESSQVPPKAAPQVLVKKTSVWRDLLSLFIKIVAIAAVSALITYFVYGFHRNSDPDMRPMIKDGDLVMFYRLDKDYAIGDLLLLSYQGDLQVRRVIARSGDTVDFTEEYLVVNDAIQQEPEIFQKTRRYESGITFPLTVPEGQVFVLGDARENATDSRVYGPVDIEDTLGTVITVIRRRNL